MSERLEMQRATASYGTYVTGLLASQARNGYADIPIKMRTDVPRGEVLDQFLIENPNFKRFRPELAKQFSEVSRLSLDADRWNQKNHL